MEIKSRQLIIRIDHGFESFRI